MCHASQAKKKVVIRNWNYQGGALLFGIIFTAIAIGTVYFAAQVMREDDQPQPDRESVILLIIAIVFLVVAVSTIHEALVAYPLQIEVGDDLTYRTIFGVKTLNWSDIEKWTFEEVEKQFSLARKIPFLPLPRRVHRVLVFHLVNDRELRIKVNAEQEAAVMTLIKAYGPRSDDTIVSSTD